MGNNHSKISSFINNLEGFIQSLFEEGVGMDLDVCRRSPIYLFPFSVPCPQTHSSYSDWRTEKDKIYEDICRAKLKLAFDRAQPIKSRLKFYDLICIALSRCYSDEMKKFFISEVLKFTDSEEVRDHFAEELFKLNH